MKGKHREGAAPPKKLKHAQKPWERTGANGWYEVIESFPEGGERVRNVPEAEGHRVFVLGKIEEVVIIEVPDDMPTDARDALGRALSKVLQRNVFLTTERIKFMRLRRANPIEERQLDGIQKEEKPAALARASGRDDGPRRVDHGDGDRSDRAGAVPAEDPAHGSAAHAEDGDQRSGEIPIDP